MPFIRYTRDKRGYETTFVMHGYRPAQGPQRTRVLYLFRAPSHVRMGRRPLDEEAREALEHTHPDLSFDWSALGRESEEIRSHDRDRDRDRDRDGGRNRRNAPPARSQRPAAPAPPIVIDDQSLLGRTVGGATAIRLRARYAELLQRIARRSRTPEERDRLTEHAQRLNPDEWPDAEVARTRAQTVEAEWDALVGELPARRRGRRGGRRRDGTSDSSSSPGASDAGSDTAEEPDESGASDIMAADGERDAFEDVVDTAGPGDDGRDGVDAGGLGADADTTGRGAGHDIPGDDEFRQD